MRSLFGRKKNRNFRNFRYWAWSFDLMGSNWKFTLLILGIKRDDFCNPMQSWKYLEDSQDKIVVSQDGRHAIFRWGGMRDKPKECLPRRLYFLQRCRNFVSQKVCPLNGMKKNKWYCTVQYGLVEFLCILASRHSPSCCDQVLQLSWFGGSLFKYFIRNSC